MFAFAGIVSKKPFYHKHHSKVVEYCCDAYVNLKSGDCFPCQLFGMLAGGLIRLHSERQATVCPEYKLLLPICIAFILKIKTQYF